MRKKIILSLLIIFCIFIDQITKLFFSFRDFIFGPLSFRLVKNFGLSFSLDFGATLNFALIGLGLFFLGYYYHKNIFSDKQKLVLLLIFSGAVSNIIDRLYFGYVRDFIDLGLGFSFNLADVFIVVGLTMLLLTPNSNSFEK